MKPFTTWVSQNLILSAALVWGLSYLADPCYRIPFSEVFPPTLEKSTPMWFWGLMLFLPALLGLVSDGILRLHHGRPRQAYYTALIGHWWLSLTYVSLVAVAILDGSQQIQWHLLVDHPWSRSGLTDLWHFWSSFISACSRPVLWWVITYLHSTYARLHVPTEAELAAMENIGRDHPEDGALGA